MTDRLVSADDIGAAARLLDGRIMRSPLVPLGHAGALLKAESLQGAGSFKIRGALNSMLDLDEAGRRRGVVAHSSGNHAIAVALAGRELGIPVTVVMPDDAPAAKVGRTRELGARVVPVEPSSEARMRRAQQLARDEGLAMVEPYDSLRVLAATATIGVEILDDLTAAGDPSPVIYVPVSGGGLAGGVAAGAKLRDPTTTVIGVEPDVAADALASRRAGRPVALPAEQMQRTIADGLRVQQVGALPWLHLEAYLDDIVTVSEEEIREAMRHTAFGAGLVAEPSGAVATAAALAGRGLATPRDRPVVAVLSGRNIDPSVLAPILAGR